MNRPLSRPFARHALTAALLALAAVAPAGAAAGPFGVPAANAAKLTVEALNNLPAFKIVQAILGLKAAAEKAGKAGQMPTAEQVLTAMQGVSYGEYGYDAKTGKPSVANVKSNAGDCLMPPDGTSHADWIKAGFPDAKCN